MSDRDLLQIEKELKKRCSFPYEWGRQQNDFWDKESNFIYTITSWEALLLKIDVVAKTNNFNREKFLNYSINRWYNFLSSRAVEQVFAALPGVKKAVNFKDKNKDFNLKGIDFDHKTSVFPNAFPHSLEYAQKNPKHLIKWLYKNQSSQQRQHFANRLFIIVYSRTGEHWKLKSEISWLEPLIKNYVTTFEASNLQKLHFSSEKITYADIIWAVK